MSPQLLLIAGIVGGAFATTVAMWLVGMAARRVKQPAKRPLWVIATVVAALVAAALMVVTYYAIYVATAFHGWFVEPELFFPANWAWWLGGLLLVPWGLAFWRWSDPIVQVEMNIEQTARPVPADA